jgi:20S proteasome subunit beta 5
MTEDEAIALGIKAIRHATFCDAFSGGFIGVYVTNKDGWRKVFSKDVARSPRDVAKEEQSA